MPPWLVDGIQRAVDASYVQFVEQAVEAGELVKAELTDAGRARYEVVRRRYVHPGA